MSHSVIKVTVEERLAEAIDKVSDKVSASRSDVIRGALAAGLLQVAKGKAAVRPLSRVPIGDSPEAYGQWLRQQGWAERSAQTTASVMRRAFREGCETLDEIWHWANRAHGNSRWNRRKAVKHWAEFCVETGQDPETAELKGSV